MGVLILLFIIIWSIYFYKRWKFRKDHPELIQPSKPKLPAHEQAMVDLETLKEQKLWQRGLEKEYYTELTDILRTYIEDRFKLNAMEMTSSEILDLIKNQDITKSSISNLNQVLELADFVKFAKMHPLPDENELSYMNAKMFVSQTIEITTIDTTEATEKAQDQ